ncbi:uncharacterized protein QC764_702430 [Podospora pseudoanserina]|uniref:SUN domain-containing protein n=1 Tax=Podospora pseudoanserina TaxID=2609844 RepID=A0ABR0HIY3_9PEZI|nr:hypothetical protein QC764_702430 [Podospora pseudoanserina]
MRSSPTPWRISPALGLVLLGLYATAVVSSGSISETPAVTAPSVTTTAIVTTPTAPATAALSVTSPGVCEFKTINYITHTLPQQCLRSAWTSPKPAATAVVESTAAETVTVSITSVVDNATQQEQAAVTEQKEEEESVAFMSFEEWKEMMLRKSGQDPANIKKAQKQHHGDHHKPDREPGLNNDNMDSLGNDGEILDFDALTEKVTEITSSSSGDAVAEASKEVQEEQILYDDNKTPYYRSKDAGKTCKERFSFSSFDAGATILKTSPGAKNAKAILVENKDTYMLLECHRKNKFVIVELSDDILVDTVVLANFEFFSSMIRKFRVSASDRYPVKLDKWVDLGTFEARNARDIQPFLVEHPQIYTKYIRIEFLSHYGNEYYCPVSLLRVHGTRMLDSWKEPREDDEPEQIEGSPTQEVVPEIQEPPLEPASVMESEQANDTKEASPDTIAIDTGSSPWQPYDSHFVLETCAMRSTTTSDPTPASGPDGAEKHNNSTPKADAGAEKAVPADKAKETPKAEKIFPSPVTGDTATGQGQPNAAPPASNPPPQPDSGDNANTGNHQDNQKKPPNRASDTSPDTTLSQGSAKPPGKEGEKPSNATRSKTTPTSGHPSSSPTVQESFFKQVNKRLQHLESNTSLSLQYIEEQSRFLQEVLRTMERKQLTRVDSFLNTLNQTVFSELRHVRTQYDQMWQSTVIALETQREQSDRQIVALTTRLNVLADEVVFQKRMAIFQSVLILSCLVLVIFTNRGGSDSSFLPPSLSRDPSSAAAAYYRRYAAGFMSNGARSETASPPPISPVPGSSHFDSIHHRMTFSPSPPSASSSSAATLAASALPRQIYSPTGIHKRPAPAHREKSLPMIPPLTPESSREGTPAIHISNHGSPPDDQDELGSNNNNKLQPLLEGIREESPSSSPSPSPSPGETATQRRRRQQQLHQPSTSSLLSLSSTDYHEVSSIETNGEDGGKERTPSSPEVEGQESEDEEDDQENVSQDRRGARKPLPALPDGPN